MDGDAGILKVASAHLFAASEAKAVRSGKLLSHWFGAYFVLEYYVSFLAWTLNELLKRFLHVKLERFIGHIRAGEILDCDNWSYDAKETMQ